MTETPDTAQHDGATLSFGRLALGVIVLGVIAAGAWGVFEMRSRKLDSEAALKNAIQQNEELQREMANLQATVADIKTAELYQQEEQTLAKDTLSVILDRTERIGDDLQKLADAHSRWQSSVEELKDGQTGRRIASDPALVELLATVLNTAPADDEPEKLGERLRRITTQLREAMAEESVSFKPTEEFISRIDEIEEAVEKSHRWYRDHLLELAALEDQAEELAPAERTLRAALLSREAERAQERVEKLATRNREIQRQSDETVGAAEAEAQRIIDEAKAEAKRLVGEATAARITQAAMEQKAEQEEELRRRQEAEKLAQLKREYQRDLRDIKVKLQPFITDGYTYNGDTGREGPVSLSVLRGRGALDEGRKGLEKLLYVGGTSTNDRDRGGFPQYVGSEYAWRQLNKDFLVQAQDYLNKYGALLVEDGLLAP